MNNCKFCGAGQLFNENGYTAFDCGAHRYGADEWGQSVECLSRQLAWSEARAKELFEALGSYDNVKQDSVWRKHAKYFRKEA